MDEWIRQQSTGAAAETSDANDDAVSATIEKMGTIEIRDDYAA
jgi:hypothetical protein